MTLAFITLQVFVLVFMPAVLTGASGAISQSYQTADTNIVAGALLSLQSEDSVSVELANSSNATNLVGVASDQPLVSLSEDSQGTVQTVIGGTTHALVSDINGAVAAGDKIAASPLDGVGMKASMAGEVVGTAQASLDSVETAQRTVETEDNNTKTINVGLLPIAVNVTYYSAVDQQQQGGFTAFVPPFLQDLANDIADKDVSPVRVLLGALTLLLGFSAAMLMLFVSIRNSFTSIGRNPLAEQSLRKELINVIISAIGVLALSTAVVYAILLG